MIAVGFGRVKAFGHVRDATQHFDVPSDSVVWDRSDTGLHYDHCGGVETRKGRREKKNNRVRGHRRL